MPGTPLSNSVTSYGLPALHDPMDEMNGNSALMVPDAIKAACALPWTAIKTTPDHTAETASELLFGEPVDIIGEDGDWLNIISVADGYTGWVLRATIGGKPSEPTHRVCASMTHVYRRPDIKSEPMLPLPMGAYVSKSANADTGGKFLALSTGGFIFKTHVAAIGTYGDDPLVTAEKFIASPYLWGGRTHMGIDCSGLVQMSLAECGHRILRDSSSQHRSLGRTLTSSETPQRGDLAFLNGHVGWMIDGIHLLHANATHMAVTIDPVVEVLGWLQNELGSKAFLEYRRLWQ